MTLEITPTFAISYFILLIGVSLIAYSPAIEAGHTVKDSIGLGITTGLVFVGALTTLLVCISVIADFFGG